MICPSFIISHYFDSFSKYRSYLVGRAVAQAVIHWLPTAAAQVRAGSGHLEFVVEKVALGQVFSEYFGFPCQSSFHQLLHNHHHL
jgi:hypothetical protein